jgi:type II secretory pathway pseudopilin PulG
LYFAIVAIWAGVLMPRWLRPRHRAEDAQGEPAAADAVASFAQPGLAAGDGAPASRAAAEPRPRPAAETRRAPGSRPVPEPREDPGRRTERAAEHAAAWSDEDGAGRRANVLRARRRMLSTLVVLTLGAVAIAATHVAAWWVIVPPGVLLAGFLLLLREAARSDAARARRETHYAAAAQRRQDTARPGAEARAGEPEVFERIASAPEAPQPDTESAEEARPTAEIIDISARVTDQLYDQYTDAAERAVGD